MSTASLTPATATDASIAGGSSVAVPAATPQAPAASVWLFGPKVDLIVGCGLWTIPLLLLTAGISAASLIAVALTFHFLSLFCNYPHYMATIYRAYGTAEDFAKYRLFTIYFTAILVAVAFVAHVETFLVPLLFTVYITWSPWHYTGQNFGLAMMFARRAGAQPTRLTRNLLQWAFLGSYLTMILGMHTGAAPDPYLLSLGLRAEVAQPVRLLASGLFFLAGSYAITRLVLSAGWRSMVATLTLFGTQFLWFVAPSMYELIRGQAPPPVYYTTGALAFMHCSQYLWVTTYYARREAEAGIRGGGRWSPLAYAAILVVGGMALFLPGPWLMSRLLHVDFTHSLIIFVSIINIHHFMVDGVIWKLRDGRIAQLLLGRRPDGTVAGPGAVDAWLTRAARRVMSPAPLARTARWAAVVGMVSIAAVDMTQTVLTVGVRGLDAAEIAYRINPYDARALVARAGLLADQGRDAEALATLRRAIDLNDRNVAALRLMGSLLVRGGFRDEAWELYQRAEARVAPDIGSLINIGLLAQERGDPDEAERRLRDAYALDRSRRDVLLNLGELLLERGDFDEARKAFGTFLEASPVEEMGDRVARRRYLAVALRLAETYVALGQFHEASDALLEIGQLGAHLTEWDVASKAHSLLATLLEQANRRAEALEFFQSAVMIASSSPDPGDVGRMWLQFARFLDRGGWSDRQTYLAYLSAHRRLAQAPGSFELIEAREGVRALAGRLPEAEARDVRDRADELRLAILEWTPDALATPPAPGAAP